MNPADRTRLRRWQGVTLVTLLVGYAGYYLCRTNLAVSATLLEEDPAAGVTQEAVGVVMSCGILLYALGKFVSGVFADALDGRRLFLGGMLASVVCTFVFGLGTGVVVFAVVWSVNRFAQSMGWSALVRIAAHWFPASRQATVMGTLSVSFLLGDAAAKFILGQFIKVVQGDYDRYATCAAARRTLSQLIPSGTGWRGVFATSGVLLAGIAAGCWLTLRSAPADVGVPEPEEPRHDQPPPVVDAEGGAWRMLGLLLSSPMLWQVTVISFGLTLVRETFNSWTPTYLEKFVGLTKGDAAVYSLAFPLAGAAAVPAGGFLSQLCDGRHGRVMLPSLVLLTGVLALLALAPLGGRPVEAVLLLAAAGACLLIPYSFCAGVMSIDLGGRKAGATASGVVDAGGYLGGVLSGWGVAAVATRFGWPTAFGMLAGITVVTCVPVVVYMLTPARKKGASSVPDIITRLLELLDKHGGGLYGGEAVTQREHALQAALAAERAGAGPALVAAALLHDVGHLLPESHVGDGDKDTDLRHEAAGAAWLTDHFPPEVVEPIRLHVAAKRYLCFAEPSYWEGLSPASRASLRMQGGPFTADEARAFLAQPHAAAAVELRRWDETAKVPGLPTPLLEHYRPYLEAVLLPRN
jgi:OPA family glycerol-3-phosphate transporter-like MFS transporter